MRRPEKSPQIGSRRWGKQRNEAVDNAFSLSFTGEVTKRFDQAPLLRYQRG